MRKFGRGLQGKALCALRKLAEANEENWWKDLLSLWRPSGVEAGNEGLRIAVRKGYLNFYLRGQSVARIGFERDCTPYLTTHVKYAFPNETSREYARLSGVAIRHPKEDRCLAYEGLATLRTLIVQADKKKGAEKSFVDDVVAHNDSVIDLEMGLPAFDQNKRAPRIDLVALERDQARLRIVFWEAKLINDPRLVAREVPKVSKQIDDYMLYLKNVERRTGVEDAYHRACNFFLELHDMAKVLNPEIAPLGEIIAEGAKHRGLLDVDPSPRLLIFDNGSGSGAWTGHLERLRRDFGVPCLVLPKGSYVLRYPKLLA
jgi:hypothetical protein